MSRRSGRIITYAAGAVLLATAVAGAQDPDAPVFGRSSGFSSLHLEPASMALTLVSRYSRSTNNGAASSSLDFREIVDASTRGYFYDPALLEFSLQGAFGLSQSRFDADPGVSGAESGTLYTYDAQMTLLSEKPATLTLYATQTDQLVNPAFAPTMEARATKYGADLYLKSPDLPTVLRAYHNEQTQTSLGGSNAQDYSLDQNTFEWRTQSKQNYQTLDWLYQYNQVEAQSASAGTTSYDSQTADLVYSRSFGASMLNDWTVMLDYYDQRGDLSQERKRGQTDLTLRHSKNFETFGAYAIDSSTIDDSTSTLQKVIGGFRHHLWGSLRTTGRVGANFLDDEQGPLNREEYGNLIFDYTKRVAMGRFSANLSLQASRQENESRSEAFHVIDELHTFVDPAPIQISRRNIIPTSLVITDPTRARVYTQGVDYTMLWFPTHVQLLRAAGGAIPANASVLVDYFLLPQGSSVIDTYTIGTGVRYDYTSGALDGLGLFARYLTQNQSVDSDDPGYVPNQIHDVTVGMDYHIGDWMFNTEYENHDSTISPFESWRSGAQYSRRVSNEMVVAANVNYLTYRYPDTHDVLKILTTAATLEYTFSTHLSGTASGGWFHQDDRLMGETTGTEGMVGLRWHYGKTQVYSNVRQVHLETDSNTSDFQLFEVGLTRRF